MRRSGLMDTTLIRCLGTDFHMEVITVFEIYNARKQFWQCDTCNGGKNNEN